MGTDILYKGFYRSKLLCVSTTKGLIREYLHNIRKLNNDFIEINMEYITNDSIFLKYEKYLLEDCYGFYIPTIDVDIIDKDYQLYLSTYTNSVEFNKDFLRTIYPLLSKDEYDTMLESIKIMIKFNNKKKLNRKMKEMFYLTHPIFNININEYFELMKRYNEIDQMDKRYKFLVEE